MTHDKLLAKIDEHRNDYNYVAPHKALRAVVELHKPQEKDFPDEHEYCVICSDFEYPCQTIQAIEKELS